jgi:hypothetical protein
MRKEEVTVLPGPWAQSTSQAKGNLHIEYFSELARMNLLITVTGKILFVVRSQATNPDIPISHRLLMIL